MKQYDAQKAKEKFETKLGKIVNKMDHASEKEHELRMALLQLKMMKLISKRAQEIEKHETGNTVLYEIALTAAGYDVRFFVEDELQDFSLEEEHTRTVDESKIEELHPAKTKQNTRTL